MLMLSGITDIIFMRENISITTGCDLADYTEKARYQFLVYFGLLI